MIGDRIKELRNQNNISQQRLADLLNLTQQAIGKWEKGISEPNIEAIIKMSKIFNVTVSYLILGEEEADCNITKKEKRILKAYRNKPELQNAVDILLQIENKEENNSSIKIIEPTFIKQK
ncbi:MAG: helix-turn-helix transcriptional regulator [Treponema sp.]|nr:helix-turn-helix transcriptional regulator [Clostridia bacterium]MBP3607078.1 helix-turn-helix transcriptional regulator [Treponema sp.]